MALVLADRVQETTTTTGTGTITLAGAVSGYQSFSAIGNGNTTYYTITSGTAWEVGIGTYTSAGTTLARTTILSSSAGGSAITLAGTSNVFATYPAEKSVNQDASGNVTVAGIISSSATISGSAAKGAFTYGTLGYSDTNNVLTGQTSVNSYSQMVMQNTSAGTAASANYNVSNDITTATTNYGEFGINSSGFTGSGAFSTANNVYLTATSGDLAIGTTTSNSIRFVVNGGATDAATISSAGLLTADSFASSSAAITGGSINGTAIGGTTTAAARFTTLGWTGVKYTAAGSAQGAAITDYFTSTISLDAASIYNIECVVVFSKATAGTVTWTWTCSSAPTFLSSMLSEIPITGFTNSAAAATVISGTVSTSALATATHIASGSLTTAVNHIFRFQVMVMTNAATTIQLRSTQSAGTLTPQAGSFMRASKVL